MRSVVISKYDYVSNLILIFEVPSCFNRPSSINICDPLRSSSDLLHSACYEGLLLAQASPIQSNVVVKQIEPAPQF